MNILVISYTLNGLAQVPTYVIHTQLPAFIGLACAFTEPGPRLEAQ